MWNTVRMIQNSRWWTLLLFCLFATIPVGMVIDQYTQEEGLIPVINFGKRWNARQLTPVYEMDVITPTRFGYDGQFYAQLALDPSLQDPGMERAMDRARYRAHRIGLPVMAYLLGFGHAWWTLQIYAALNLVFWFLLFFILWKTIGFKRIRDVLLACSLLWTTGTLISISKALTDLPAAVISYSAVVLPSTGWSWAILLGIAALFKETTILSFVPAWSSFKQNGLFSKKTLIQAGLLILPVAMWAIYVQYQLSAGRPTQSGNFTLPFFGVVEKLTESSTALVASAGEPLFYRIGLFLESVSLCSIFVQALYLFLKPKWSNRYWQFGIGFAVLFPFLGPSVLAGQFAFTRVLLPLTMAFNLLIHQSEKQTAYYGWFILGNVGLGGLAIRFVLTLLGY
ncbi:MAG: hypothetical protein K9I85_07375 [Saprospiraceae bacterium]|nr:hypothetical protein [Saprospiraceae bacterium]